MRKIEQGMIQAIKERKNWKRGNTEVRLINEEPFAHIHVVLHGNVIADFTHAFGWMFTLAGWPGPTTRSRVNALLGEFRPGLRVVQAKGEQRLVDRSGGSGGYSCRPLDSKEWF